MRTLAAALLLLPLSLAGAARAEEPAKAAAPKPEAAKPAAKAEAKPDDQKTLYGVGLAIARSLDTFALTPAAARPLERQEADRRSIGLGRPRPRSPCAAAG